MEETKLKGPVEYIKEAWGIYTKKENFILFARIMAVLALISGIPSQYLRYAGGDLIAVIWTVIGMIVSIWVGSIVYTVILNISDISFKDAFILGFKNMWKYTYSTLVPGLIALFGLVILIVPGVIFSVWFAFTLLLVLDKKLGLTEALRASKALVMGRFWKILGRLFVFGIFTFIISLPLIAIPVLGGFLETFLMPLFSLPFYLLYRDLSSTQNDLSFKE